MFKVKADTDVAMTALVIAFFENKLKAKKEVWEMVVAKARTWMTSQTGGDSAKVDELIREAAKCLSGDDW